VIISSACARTPRWRRRQAWRSASAEGSASTTRCAQATRTSLPSATPSRSRTSSRASGASSRWPGRRTGRAVSRPTSSRARLPLPRHPGHLDHRALRRGGGLDRRKRKDAQPGRRQRFRENLPLPELPRGYYPGARPIAMKVIFRKSDGRLLGAQALGEDNVDKRISALAVAIQMGATIYDLEEAELCYSPQFGSAKDPVNFAGMVAAGVLRGDMPIRHWNPPGRNSSSTCASPWNSPWSRRRGGQHPAGPAPGASRRAPARPRDPGHLPVRPARLLRAAHAAAERVQGTKPLRGHAVAVSHTAPGELSEWGLSVVTG